jgi:rod shape-determining protein MreD
MRNTAFLALGFALLVIQANLFRIVDLFHVSGVTPSLLLPLILFMGVHEYSIARGAALSFVLGYLLDLFAGAPVGLFTFMSVATFLIARVAGVRLAAQTLLTKVALAFAFALLEGVLLVVLTAIFGGDAQRPRALALIVPQHAISTALVAPLVFRLAERVHLATIASPSQNDAHGGGRS